MLASAGFEDVHEPPGVASASVMDVPWHKVDVVNVIGDGAGFTVNTRETAQEEPPHV